MLLDVVLECKKLKMTLCRACRRAWMGRAPRSRRRCRPLCVLIVCLGLDVEKCSFLEDPHTDLMYGP